MPAGMVQADFGPVAKVKKIAEKNAAKGQNSLSTFFNGNNGVQGTRSNRSAFEHYAIASAAYSTDMINKDKFNTNNSNNPNPEEE